MDYEIYQPIDTSCQGDDKVLFCNNDIVSFDLKRRESEFETLPGRKMHSSGVGVLLAINLMGHQH